VEFNFEVAQLFEGELTSAFLLIGGGGAGEKGWRFWAWRLGSETDAADVEVFLEAVELEEIGEFEGADVATGMADFPLKIAHDLGQVSEGKAGAEELEPEPLPVKTPGEVLTGEAAIGLVQLLQVRRP